MITDHNDDRWYTRKELARRDLLHLVIGWLIGVIVVGGTVMAGVVWNWF